GWRPQWSPTLCTEKGYGLVSWSAVRVTADGPFSLRTAGTYAGIAAVGVVVGVQIGRNPEEWKYADVLGESAVAASGWCVAVVAAWVMIAGLWCMCRDSGLVPVFYARCTRRHVYVGPLLPMATGRHVRAAGGPSLFDGMRD